VQTVQNGKGAERSVDFEDDIKAVKK
jgi:hypothetical protein